MNGGTWLVEHKTSSQDIGAGAPFWRKLAMDAQCSIYIDAARRSGYDVRGVIYDVTAKPAHRPKKDETPAEFGQRVLLAIASEPDEYYRRGKVVRLETEARESLIDVWQLTRNIRTAVRDARWPRNTDACERYHRFCEYFDVCTGSTSIEDDSVYRPKDVTKHLSKSSMEAFRRCPREFYYSKVLGRARGHRDDALRIGTEYHKALEVWFKTLDVDQAVAAMGGCKDEFERNKLAAMMIGYDARWRDEPLSVLAVEKEFTLPLRNPVTGRGSRAYTLTGKFDAIVQEEDQHATASAAE